jgi:hypothetical protein
MITPGVIITALICGTVLVIYFKEQKKGGDK